MSDPEGPGRHAPRQCSTLTLADLGDTVGFREPGDKHKTYGFKLDDKGYYSRAEIPPASLGQPDDWDVQLEIRRPVAYLEHNQMLVRLENLGKCLASYQSCKVVTRTNKAPVIHYQSFLKVIRADGMMYGIQATETKPQIRFCMKASTEFDADLAHLAKPPPGSTIYLELVIYPTAQTEPVSVLPGVSIKWAATNKARHIALIITASATEAGKWTARSTAPDVVVELKDGVGVDELIFGVNWVFVRLLFSSDPVSDHRIDHLISQLKN